MLGGMSSPRSLCTTPLMSVRVILSTGRPIATSRSTQASAAAPAPLVTSLTSDKVLPCSTSPLRMAAAQTMAVPCWSSWKTGIFMRSRSFFSMTKHSGALMSSRLMPPKVGSSAATMSTKRSMSVSSTSRSNTSMPANFLNRTALPSITGLEARGPILPSPSTAVPLVITATRLPRAVYSRASDGIGGDGFAGGGDAGRIGQRQVALVGHALGGFHRQFAGPGMR